MAYQVVQYQIKAEPIPLGAVETSTPDKWLGEGPDNPPRRPYVVALVASAAFVPVVSAAATPLYVNGQACEPVAVQQLQYQGKAEPLTVPSAPTETVTSDKWDRGQSQPLPQLKRSAEFPAYVTDNSSLLAPEQNTLDKWVVRIEQPRRELKRNQWLYPSSFAERLDSVPAVSTPLYVSGQACEPTSVIQFQYQGITKPVFTPAAAAETITLDKWQGAWPQPHPVLKRLVQYGVNFAIAEQADDGLAPVYWLLPTNTPPRASRALVATGSSELRQTSFAESITVDKWWRQIQVPLRDLSRRQAIYPTVVSDYLAQVPSAEVIRVDKWNRSYPDLLFAAVRLRDYGQFVIDPTLTTERASIDKWGQPVQEPLRRIAHREYIYPISVADYLAQIPGAEVIRVDKWGRNYPDRVWGASRLRDYTHFTVDPTLTAERASIDKWGQPIEQPRFDLKRSQWLYPPLALDSQFYLIPPIEIIRLDKWVRQYPDVIFRARKLADYSQFSIDPTLTSERASVDKWAQPVIQPRFIKRQIVPDGPFIFVPESITVDKWLSSPELARRKEIRIYTSGELIINNEPQILAEQPLPQFRRVMVIPVSAQVIAELPLKEWRELVQPFMPRDLKRTQYLYSFYVAGTDISINLTDGMVVIVPVEFRSVEVEPDDRLIIVPIANRIVDV